MPLFSHPLFFLLLPLPFLWQSFHLLFFWPLQQLPQLQFFLLLFSSLLQSSQPPLPISSSQLQPIAPFQFSLSLVIISFILLLLLFILAVPIQLMHQLEISLSITFTLVHSAKKNHHALSQVRVAKNSTFFYPQRQFLMLAFSRQSFYLFCLCDLVRGDSPL